MVTFACVDAGVPCEVTAGCESTGADVADVFLLVEEGMGRVGGGGILFIEGVLGGMKGCRRGDVRVIKRRNGHVESVRT